MRLFKIIIITILLGMVILPIGKYIHAKTIGKDISDCMINYVNNYYPYGSVYSIDGDPHIDKRGLYYLDNEVEIYGCFINDSFISFIFNTPYCYLTLWLEKIF